MDTLKIKQLANGIDSYSKKICRIEELESSVNAAKSDEEELASVKITFMPNDGLGGVTTLEYEFNAHLAKVLVEHVLPEMKKELYLKRESLKEQIKDIIEEE